MVDLVAASDVVGHPFLSDLISTLPARVRPAIVCEPSESYAIAARTACAYISSGRSSRALLVCGTGIGMSISANRIPNIRAAVCHDPYTMRRSILSNDCQVICFGSRVIGIPLAELLLTEWMSLSFDTRGPSAWKVREIDGSEASSW